MKFPAFFSETYTEAREKLLEAAHRAQARCVAVPHPGSRTPSGEQLYVDFVTLGEERARNALLIISGTHGQEGFAGSAAQTALVTQLTDQAPRSDTLILLVHALNPYGFAHTSRTTEQNVDLNRNFLPRFSAPVDDPLVDEIQAFLCPEELPEDPGRAFSAFYSDLLTRHPAQRLQDALAAGQRTHPLGITFAGSAPEWSNVALTGELTRQLQHVHDVAYIEWHTGLGAYGEPAFLCFADSTSEAFRRAARWWGEAELQRAGEAFEGRPVPKYAGLVFDGVTRGLPNAKVAGAVVEFGTVSNAAMAGALMIDRWLRFGRARDEQQQRQRRAEMMECFYPRDPKWRQSVLARSLTIMDRAYQGIGA